MMWGLLDLDLDPCMTPINRSMLDRTLTEARVVVACPYGEKLEENLRAVEMLKTCTKLALCNIGIWRKDSLMGFLWKSQGVIKPSFRLSVMSDKCVLCFVRL